MLVHVSKDLICDEKNLAAMKPCPQGEKGQMTVGNFTSSFLSL